MKKIFVLAMALMMVVGFSGVSMAAGISGTDHDFSGKGWNSSGEICIVCHTPHKSDTSVTDAPLWNHTITSKSFTVYSSATLDATVGQPDGISKLCLSCHDGTIALDALGGAGGSANNTMTGDKAVGADELDNDHPISFTYDTALATADGGLNDPATTLSGISTTGTIDADMLFSSKLECASCHDVHDDTNGKFLRKSNAASALCLTCHDK